MSVFIFLEHPPRVSLWKHLVASVNQLVRVCHTIIYQPAGASKLGSSLLRLLLFDRRSVSRAKCLDHFVLVGAPYRVITRQVEIVLEVEQLFEAKAQV